MQISPLGFPWKTEDPFLFCVHHLDHYPKGNDKLEPAVGTAGRNLGNDFQVKDGWRMYHGQKIPGFPYHPHKGFETVSIVEKGVIDHSDSIGGAGRFSSGDTQWMTAGKGILHSEMFPMLNQDNENTLELFQIWINLPAKDKLVEPHFKMLWNEQTPIIHFDDNKVKIQLIAGNLEKAAAQSPPPHSWASKTENEVQILILTLKPGANFNFGLIAPEIKRNLYFYSGEKLTINGTEIPPYHNVQLESQQDYNLESQDECKLLFLQGRPINEPVAQHGPFVMNTAQEIQEAFQEYRMTGFGGWPWPLQEQVHDSKKQRFAIHSDGKFEERDFISE
jgi:redox-sensitive bicupin YhaK (pirin superfamily)